MKKLMMSVCFAALIAPVFAEEAATGEEENKPEEVEVETPRKNVAPWPAFFAVAEIPETPDIVGFRLTIPYSTKQESVTGIDIGLWGRCSYFEGFQLNLIRNDVKDYGSCFQVGLYNSIGSAETFGLQVGLWNECGSIYGIQAGLVNLCGQGQGFQVGLINRAEELNGFQVGLINVIRSAEIQFMPLINIGF